MPSRRTAPPIVDTREGDAKLLNGPKLDGDDGHASQNDIDALFDSIGLVNKDEIKTPARRRRFLFSHRHSGAPQSGEPGMTASNPAASRPRRAAHVRPCCRNGPLHPCR